MKTIISQGHHNGRTREIAGLPADSPSEGTAAVPQRSGMRPCQQPPRRLLTVLESAENSPIRKTA